jgi:putative ABC transport system permease protein
MSPRWLAGWPMDLKLGWRMLRRSPGLTVVAVVTLGVAIGAGAAYLEFTRDLLRPALPAPDGDRIVGIQLWDRERGAPQRQALADFAVWRRAAGTLEFVGAARPLDRHLVTDDGRFEPARAVEISTSAFRLFPTAPLVGRTLVESDERPGAAPVIVIGHDLWRARFDADANVAGRTVRMGSVVHTIVGVMPEGFGFPFNQNLWAPLNVPSAGMKRGEGPAVQMFGRLKSGVGAAAAQAQLQGLLETGATLRADVRPYIDMQVMGEPGNPAQRAVVHAANLVFVMLLAICGANVATLVFARTAMRHAEISVRTALGASRARIGAQLFAEALVLSLLAAVAGLAAARFGGQWITRAITERGGLSLPFWWDDRLSPETILYAFVLAVFAALLVGVTPALKATSGSAMKFGRVWTGVTVTQVATTIIFLAAVASLGWTTFRGRLDYDVTFAREQYLTATLVPLDDAAGVDASIRQAAYRAVADRLTSEPGVVGVTYANDLPGAIEPEWFWLEFATPDVAAGAAFDRSGPGSGSARVGPNYFETMGIPLVAGRLFTQSEIESDRPVAVVDETFVRLILGGRSAVGLMVREPRREAAGTAGPWHEIVGVVKDATIMTRKKTADAMLYRPASIAAASPLRMLVRTQAAAAPMAQRIQAAALSAHPDLRLVDVMSLDQVAARGGHARRFLLRAFAVVAVVALLLSTAGIYSLISFTLARRTREIGIRAALGAGPRRIVTSVLARAFAQIGAGVLAGAVPAAVIMTSGVDDSGALGMPAGVGATMTLCAFVVVVALISCATPLRRAVRIDPMQALRTD